jgi:tRNA-dihydrouridine synthase
MYEGVANWEILKDVADVLTVPFIGNGDIKTPEDAKRMLEKVGADAAMVGRAALGNPWVLKRMVDYLETGIVETEPSVREKVEIAKLHLERLINLKGEKIGVREFRQHAAYYLKGAPRAAKTKNAVNQSESKSEVLAILDGFVAQCEAVMN